MIIWKMQLSVWLTLWSTFLIPKRLPCNYLNLRNDKKIFRLQYGANPRYCESMESNTGLHLAAQAGNL